MSTITTHISEAITHLRQGELVAIPTETVYGLAANAQNEQAIRKIYALKNRPLDHPLIMHVSKNWDLHQWVKEIPDYAALLIKHYWPGALTLVMSVKDKAVSPLITGGQPTVAIRCPQHPITEKLLESLGFPLVAPSANPFGKLSPTTAEHVQYSFKDKPLLILDGGRCSIGIESTILAATDADGYRILRPGIIDEAMLKTLLPGKQLDENHDIRIPGNLPHHYQPEKPLYAFSNRVDLEQFIQQTRAKIVTLSFNDLGDLPGLRLPNDPKLAAFELYYQLRQADLSSAEIIIIELPPNTPPWKAVRERLLKASRH